MNFLKKQKNGRMPKDKLDYDNAFNGSLYDHNSLQSQEQV